MTRAFAMIMAGGSSEDLSVLTEVRSEPATPFGGKFRLIDFPLSNCVNSNIYNAAVLTQYRPRSLNDHIGIGKPWDMDRASGGVRLLQPYRGGKYGDWQLGTADAVRRNLDYVLMQDEEHVLILAGDHIYAMDYRQILALHDQMKADVTVGVIPVPIEEAHRFGIVTVDANGRVVNFIEKPRFPQSNLVSMGIYVFNREILREYLTEDAIRPDSVHDFGYAIIPRTVKQHRVLPYKFNG